jgi:SAM-dependent methyltransferase
VDNAERKQHERDIYNEVEDGGRGVWAALFDADLNARVWAEFDADVEREAKQYIAGRVLILGAGQDEVDVVRRHTQDFVALNISQRVIDELKAANPGISTVVADAEEYAPAELFDAVYCRSILHHLHPLDSIVENIATWLKPGGILFVAAEPGLYNPFAAFGRRFTPTIGHTPGERPLVFARFERMLGRNYEALYSRRYFFAAMLFPMLAKRIPASKRLCGAVLRPVMGLERLLVRFPWVSELCWFLFGIYRVRPTPPHSQ